MLVLRGGWPGDSADLTLVTTPPQYAKATNPQKGLARQTRLELGPIGITPPVVQLDEDSLLPTTSPYV
ncbi:hypothetical protein PGT21_018542 [Puccinia graminis f. sp. tritici]|uniref:Uncharacterized protein n=1 Tax=Puccinia graminis f. sp. tritici TaxID=56615 RepID=A0A5B0QN85_PUCGR|nr:hypothetical protein PGT21_018542 [Puccinia graminis f. sp. tritici]